jgi:hypothetical protein
MNESDTSPKDARAALSEASALASKVRRTDIQYRLILVGLALAYVAAGVLVGFVRVAWTGAAVLLVLVATVFGSIGLMWRMRAFSRSGPRNFGLAAAAFTWWNAAVVGASVASGWWAPHQLNFHFTVSAAVASIPLLVAARLIGRGR